MKTTSRRQFLGGVGSSMGYAALGLAIAERLGEPELLPSRPDPLADLHTDKAPRR